MKNIISILIFFLGIQISYAQMFPDYPSIEYKKIMNNNWQITKDYIVKIPFDSHSYLKYTIKNGYTTNFRSGPKILDLIAKQLDEKNNNLNLAWLIHDVNYEGYLSQLDADKLLEKMLVNAGITIWKAKAIYAGLHYIFGKGAYSSFRNNTLIDFENQSLTSAINKKRYELYVNRQNNYENDYDSNSISDADKEKVIQEIKDLFPEDEKEIISKYEQEQ